MNELDIRDRVDELIEQAEHELEIIFSRALQEILLELDTLYRKHKQKGVEPSYTTLNKYNRVHAMLARIADTMNQEYQEVVKAINEMEQNIYLETYLKTMYLFQVFQGEPFGFTIPTTEVLLAAIVNPIEFLTLTKTMDHHRAVIIRELQIVIEQGLRNGWGYSDIAAEIEKKVGFSQKKARAVARTEGGRVRSVANELVYEEMPKGARIEKVWLSSLDLRVRHAHRKLDGQTADKEGYFHYKGMKSKGPHLWNRANMDINCRCTVISKVNGMLPSVRRGRNTKDPVYQEKLQERIETLMKKKNKQGEQIYTFARAFRKANREILPPPVTMPYLTYDEWYKQYGQSGK